MIIMQKRSVLFYSYVLLLNSHLEGSCSQKRLQGEFADIIEKEGIFGQYRLRRNLQTYKITANLRTR